MSEISREAKDGNLRNTTKQKENKKQKKILNKKKMQCDDFIDGELCSRLREIDRQLTKYSKAYYIAVGSL
jgi:hypothetical protein